MSEISFTIDLNCDVGEGFGPYSLGNDAAVLDWVSSANVACGMHAGDPGTMHRTVRLAIARNVAIGAHPGLPDRMGFGRRRWELSPEDAFDLVVYQVGALWAFVRSEGAVLRHVKPHGALYNMAAVDAQLAAAMAEAVRRIDPQLALMALAGSQLAACGKERGLTVLEEAFADRTYESDGTLTPRDEPGAVVTDHRMAIEQSLRIIRENRIRSRTGEVLPIFAQTLCIHGDRSDAADFARALRTALDAAQIAVRSPCVAGSPSG